MSAITITAEVLAEIKKFNRHMDAMRTKKVNEAWVKSSVICQLTGWDSNQMEKARRNGYIKFKRKNGDVGGYLYDPSSIPDVFLRKL